MTVTEASEAPADAATRRKVVEWLRANLPTAWVEAIDEGDERKLSEARRSVNFAEWCIKLGKAGWATPTWPREYGGGGLEPAQAKIVNEELGRYKVFRSFNIIGIGMGGPTIMQWGTEEQKK